MTRISEVAPAFRIAPLAGVMTAADATRLASQADPEAISSTASTVTGSPEKRIRKAIMHQLGSRTHRKALLSIALATAMAMGTAIPAAYAADQDTTTEAPSEVIVTGSRIPAPNITSTSPIQVVTEKEIKLSGHTDAIDILNSMPQNFQNSAVDFGNTSNSLSTPGGLTTADLRGLGPQRTLVLIDGKRLGTGDPNTANPNPAPDLDQIPVALIERIDVVTGGASAVYGSDAVAGVVNFIMKKNFEGIQADVQIGADRINNHNDYFQSLAAKAGIPIPTGSGTTGRNKSFSLTAGTNFADGKGNVTAYLTYLRADPVTGSDIDFAGCQLFTFPAVRCGGSANSNQYRVVGTGTNYSVVGSQLLPYPQAGSSPPAQFNSNTYVNMSRDDQRYTGGFMAHVDVSDYVKPYFDFSFMNDKSNVQIAPSGLFENSNPLTPNANYLVNCTNPLLSAQEQGILCTPGQIAADTLSPGSAAGSTEVIIGRRNIEGGGRLAYFDHVNYRAVIGTKGAIGDAWDYDAYGQYYYTSLYNSNSHYLNFANIGNALQVVNGPNGPQCISGGSCVPYNIFNQGAVTQDQLDYLSTNGTSYGTVTQKIIHADITGDLGKYGIKSPWASDGIGVNFGFEHRSEFLSYGPDSAELSGLLSGAGAAAVAINNGYSVKEGFIEARVPIAEDAPGIHNLNFDSGYRYSDYSLAGKTNTYKFELQYAPISDVTLRTSFQHAVRAPNIIELFNPQNFGLQTFLGVDPCAPTVDANNQLIPASATLAQCEHTGVTAAEFGNGGTTNSISQCVSGQCGQLTGGNPKLAPEVANTVNFGITLTPSMLPNFTGSIDYYRIQIKNEIGALPGAFYFTQCLNTGDPTYCSAITRTASGGLTGATVAGGGYILQTSVNIGAASLSGVDVQANYRIPFNGAWGAVSFALNGAYLLKTTSTPFPGAHTYDCAGLFGTTCQTINPKWRHNLRVSWELPFNLVTSLQWRFIGAAKLDNNDSDPTLNGAEFGVFNAFNARLPNMSYLDLSGTWEVHPGISLRAGINNLLNKDPPLVGTELTGAGSANTYPTYDTLGRQVFIGFTAKF